jgi:hypothetical protein
VVAELAAAPQVLALSSRASETYIAQENPATVWCHGGGCLSNGFPITDADRTRAGLVTHIANAVATKFANACVRKWGFRAALEATQTD